MAIYHLFILALIQGITEFLPISSSGHLMLFHAFFAHTPEDLALIMDIAVHIGTLAAVMVYFWRDVRDMVMVLPGLLRFDVKNLQVRLAFHLILASIPVIVAGFILHAVDPYILRSPWVIGFTTLFFGIVLWVADHRSGENLSLDQMGWRGALIIGFSQILALIPGTSRSGITMTAARFLGISRMDAARFSLLLAIVAISGAGVLASLDVIGSPVLQQYVGELFLVAGLSFISALGAITLMMRWIARQSFAVFAIYRIILGGGLLILLSLGVIA